MRALPILVLTLLFAGCVQDNGVDPANSSTVDLDPTDGAPSRPEDAALPAPQGGDAAALGPSALASILPASDGRSFSIHLEGQAGEWAMAYIPFDEPVKTFGYAVVASGEAMPGEGVAVAAFTLPQFVQSHDGKRAPGTFDGDRLLVGDGNGPAQTRLDARYLNIRAGSAEDRFEGFFLQAGGTTAWTLDHTVELLGEGGPVLVPGLLLRGNGTLAWEVPMPSDVPALQHGGFSFEQAVGPGWSFVYFMRESAEAAEASAMARLLSYEVSLPGNFTWGSDVAYGYGLWGPPATETYSSSETYTNRVVGTRSAPVGSVQGSGNYTQTDTLNRLFVVHVGDLDLAKVGLLDAMPEYAHF